MRHKIPVVLFGSYYRGLYVLHELLSGPHHEKLKVVGVATDDPLNSFVSPHKRVWRFGYSQEEKNMVRDLASSHGIEVFTERVKSPDFYEIFKNKWTPQLCIMATFGQRIDKTLYEFPKIGFFNLHPSDRGVWPSRYAGPDPFTALIQDGMQECAISVHHVDGGFDTGERVLISDDIVIPPGANATDMHKLSAGYAARVVRRLLEIYIPEATTNV